MSCFSTTFMLLYSHGKKFPWLSFSVRFGVPHCDGFVVDPSYVDFPWAGARF